MFTALTVFFLVIVLGARLFLYMPLRFAMGDSYDGMSYFFLNLMYWGLVLVVGIGYAGALVAFRVI